MRPGMNRQTTPIDPYADDPRLGRHLDAPMDDDDPDDAPADDSSPEIREFLKEGLETTQERLLAQYKRMRARLRSKDGKIRRAKLIASVLALQMEGMKRVQIAAVLGISPMVVTKALRQIREHATVADLLKKIDEQTLPIAVDNIHQAIADGDLKLSAKVMDGRGIFRSHKSIEAQVTQTKIDIRLVTIRPAHMPEGMLLPGCKPGTIQMGPPAISVLPVKVEPVDK